MNAQPINTLIVRQSTRLGGVSSGWQMLAAAEARVEDTDPLGEALEVFVVDGQLQQDCSDDGLFSDLCKVYEKR